MRLSLFLVLSFVSAGALAQDPPRLCELVAQVPGVGLRYLEGNEQGHANFSLGSQGYHSDFAALHFDSMTRDGLLEQIPESILRKLLDPKIYLSATGSLHLLSRYDAFSDRLGLVSLAAAFDLSGKVRALRHIAYYPPPDFGVIWNQLKRLHRSRDLNEIKIGFYDFSANGDMRSLGSLGHRYWKGMTHEIDLGKASYTGPSTRQVFADPSPDLKRECPLRDLMTDPNGLHVQMDQYMVLDLSEATLSDLSPRTISTMGCATCVGIGLATSGRVLVAHLVLANGSAKSLLHYWLRKYFRDVSGSERPALRLVGDGFRSSGGFGTQLVEAANELGLKVEEVDIGDAEAKGLGYSFDETQRRFLPFRCD